MKKYACFTMALIVITTQLLLTTSCSKKNDIPQWDVNRTYSVEGNIISKKTGLPVANRRIAISQKKRTYSHTDPETVTDSNGYFKLYYIPYGEKEGLNIYPVYEDYKCIYSDISFISNIPKGQDVNLKKLYSTYF